MVLRTIPYRPGEVRDDDQLAAEGYAASTQLIEWVRQRAQTWPGWATIASSNSISSAGRGLGTFADASGNRYLGLGTPSRLYAYVDASASIWNITPDRYDASPDTVTYTTGSSSVRIKLRPGTPFAATGVTIRVYGASATAGFLLGGSTGTFSSNPFTTTNGSDVVRLQVAGNTMAVGDGIVVGSAPSVGGLTLDGYYDVFNIQADTVDVQHTSRATSDATGGGASAGYMIAKPYTVTTTEALGETFYFNAGTNANASIEVSPSTAWRIRSTVNTDEQRHWAIQAYADTLIATPYRGGPPARWYADGRARARLLTNAPARASWSLVTPEGYLMLFGTVSASTGLFDPMLVRWSDDVDINIWAQASTNNANSLRLGQGSAIIGARNTQGGVLVWTDDALYLLRYTGNADGQYVAELVGTGCGLIGALAAVEQDGLAFWVSPAAQFFMYSGGRPRQMTCPMERYFRDNLATSTTARAQIHGAYDVSRSAVMWLWPFTGATENNRYIRCNLLEAARDQNAGWAQGVIDRTAWIDRGQFLNPIAVSSSGLIYVHDSGRSDAGSPVTRSLERAPFDISSQEDGDGGVKAVIRRMVFGRTHSGATLTAQLIGRDWEIDASPQTKTFTFATSTPYVDARMQARQFGFRWQTTGSNDFLREGNIRLDISKGTRR